MPLILQLQWQSWESNKYVSLMLLAGETKMKQRTWNKMPGKTDQATKSTKSFNRYFKSFRQKFNSL